MLVHIQEPWWGAHKKYGWPKEVWGVSIAKDKIDKAIELGERLQLKIWEFDEPFFVSPVTVRNYAKKHKTKNLAGKNKRVILYTIPKTLLKKE